MSKLKNNLIGDRKFYRRVIAIVLPLIIQNTITNVVSLLDNVMVGSIGTLQMSAVAIVNQLIFVFALCIFGGLAVPFAYCLATFTDMPVVLLFFLVQSLDIIKCVIGFVFIKKELWIRNIVSDK